MLLPARYVYPMGTLDQFLPASARCFGRLGIVVVCAELLRPKGDTGGQEPVCQSKTKVCFMITGRGWNSSELTSPPRRLCNTWLPFQAEPSPHFSRSSRSLSSDPKYLSCSSSTSHLQWLSSHHPRGIRCISVVVTPVPLPFVLCLPSLYLQRLYAPTSRGAESGLFHSLMCMRMGCVLHDKLFRMMLPQH